MRYRFLDCILDVERRELRRAGALVPTRRRVFQLLLLLIEQRERAVSKAQLFERLWPKRVVSDTTLNSCVKEARKAVGDTGDAQRVIQTLHRHGFRFVPAVELEDDHASAQPLTPPGRALPAIRAQDETPSGPSMGREYKQVSVLVASIVTAQSHAERIGAEAMDALMRRFLGTAQTIVERYGGVVSEWSGAGFSALFGAPLALEDHARRAVQAAMDLFAAMTRVIGENLSVEARMGLNSGAVVVGQLAADPRRVYTALGDTTSHAQRLHDCAPPGALLVSEASYQLVEADAEAEPGPPVADAPTWRIRSIRVLRGGVPKSLTRRLSRFVGRERELAVLQHGLDRADEGRGAVICLVGEPGIGKSRLLDEFRAGVPDSAGGFRADAHCLPHQTTTPYFPILALLRQACAIAETDAGETIATKLQAALRAAGVRADDARALLLELLDVPIDTEQLAGLGPEARRARTFSCLIQLILHRAAGTLCVLTIEDLHWIDATSEALIGQLVARVEAFRVLIVLTCRPGYRLPWSTSSAVTQLALRRLSADESSRLVHSVPHSPPLPQHVTAQIIDKAEGNPFFLEELTWAMARGGGPAAADVIVPSTVQAVIAARIDRLPGPDKYLLQIAAAIGAHVDRQLLLAVSEYEPSALDASTQNLQSQEFLYETVAAPFPEYTFRHALTQEVAYRSLLSGTRAHLHQRIAEVLERDFSDSASNQPEVLAHHWAAANRDERAYGYWHRAGVRARERSANLEAVKHFRRALDMNEAIERTPPRRHARLETLLALGPPLMATRGFAALEVDETYTEARNLCADVGTRLQQFTAAWGYWLHNLHRGRVALAKEMVTEILDLAARIDERACWLQAHHAAWTTALTHGDIAECHRHAEEGIRFYTRDDHHTQAYLYGMHDPGLCARGTVAIAEWFLGRPDAALERATRNLELARELTHPYSWLLALNDLLELRCARREMTEALTVARQVIAVCKEQNVPNYLAWAGVFHGWAAAMQGELDAGIAEMRKSLSAYRALGLQRHCAHFLALLAECLCERGAIQEGLDAITEAEHLIATTEETRWSPEIRRMRGRLLLAGSTEHSAGEQALVEALEDARAQGAISLELRAATDLARLWNSTGARERARELLAPLLARFTEGSQLRDLEAARRLVESGA
jgi:class 3 adenylate cyclase/predicted ATPase